MVEGSHDADFGETKERQDREYGELGPLKKGTSPTRIMLLFAFL